MSHTPSSLATAVDAVLKTKGTDLESWLGSHVGQGSLRDLAFEIRTETAIPVSHMTLQRWIEHYGITAGAA